MEIFLKEVTEQGIQLSHTSVIFRIYVFLPAIYSLSRGEKFSYVEIKYLSTLRVKQQQQNKMYYKNALCHFMFNNRVKIDVMSFSTKMIKYKLIYLKS